MKALELTSTSAEETQRLGAALGALLRDGDVVLFKGDLGVGKTCFAKGVARGMGIDADIVSPTFNIVLQYGAPSAAHASQLCHFDLYRLEDATELEDIDFYYLVDAASPGSCLIEWSERFPDEMPEEGLEVAIYSEGETDRRIAAAAHGFRAEALLEAWANEEERG